MENEVNINMSGILWIKYWYWKLPTILYLQAQTINKLIVKLSYKMWITISSQGKYYWHINIINFMNNFLSFFI